MPGAARRSSTVTSWPSRARYQAAVTPMTPLPRMTIFMAWIPQWWHRPSYGRDRRGRRTDGARQPQWRRGEQKAVAVVRAQPGGQRRQMPDFAKMDAELEQAMLVQRVEGAAAVMGTGRQALDGIIVGHQDRKPAVGDPLQEPGVATVEDGAGTVHRVRVGLALHRQK